MRISFKRRLPSQGAPEPGLEDTMRRAAPVPAPDDLDQANDVALSAVMAALDGRDPISSTDHGEVSALAVGTSEKPDIESVASPPQADAARSSGQIVPGPKQWTAAKARNADREPGANDVTTPPPGIRPATPQKARTGKRAEAMANLLDRWRPLMPFVIATLAPAPLLLLAGFFGGVFSAIALLWMAALAVVFDEIAARRGITLPDGASADPAVLARADRFAFGLAALHIALLLFSIWVLAGNTGLGFWEGMAVFIAFGMWFGQVSNSVAHELIHRSSKWLFGAGMWVFISMLFGHHTSAHRLVHHRFVATPDDPNTAERGEGFYAFLLRAWPGALIAGYEMERARREDRTGLAEFNPYWIYGAGAAFWILTVALGFGFDGLLAYLLLCAYAQIQLHLSDYVQHYGLLRRALPGGALEPAGAQHSWDAPYPLSSLMMVNAPRHGDHHAHPMRAYPTLGRPGAGRAVLPHSLPAMATLALVPPLWRRVMDPRVDALQRR